MTDPTLMPATELAEQYRTGDLSPVEVTEASLRVIDRLDPTVHAFVQVEPEAARAAARQSEQRWRSGTQLGSADGIVVSIKDLLLTIGWPTRKGSTLIDAAGPWTEDSPAVARLREAGCVLLGKTSTPEFAWKAVTDSPGWPATGNPWNPRWTAGGSSGGSATAVGLGMSTWSVGTDGGGSVRIPAAFTGTVALKPTFGLIPHYPASAFGSLAHTGPMTRTVRDAAEMLDLLTQFDPRDPSSMPTPPRTYLADIDGGVRSLRIAYSPDLGYGHNDPEVDRAVRAAVDVLVDAGAIVEQVDPGFADPVEAFTVLWNAGAAKVLAGYPPEALDDIDPGLRRSVEHGRGLSADQYLDAMAVRSALGIRMGLLHTDYDLLVCPTMPIGAFGIGRDVPEGWPTDDWPSWTPYTYPFNLTGQPALSVPCGFTADGRPIGLQIVGARYTDSVVLRAGNTYAERTTWSQRLPTLLTQG